MVAGAAAVAVGAVVVLLTAAVGHCGAFGGRCPAPEGLHGDVYGGIAAGASLALAAPILAWRPDRRGLVTALLVLAVAVPPLTYAAAALIEG